MCRCPEMQNNIPKAQIYLFIFRLVPWILGGIQDVPVYRNTALSIRHTLKYQNKQSKSCTDCVQCELKDRPVGHGKQHFDSKRIVRPHIKILQWCCMLRLLPCISSKFMIFLRICCTLKLANFGTGLMKATRSMSHTVAAAQVTNSLAHLETPHAHTQHTVLPHRSEVGWEIWKKKQTGFQRVAVWREAARSRRHKEATVWPACGKHSDQQNRLWDAVDLSYFRMFVQ